LYVISWANISVRVTEQSSEHNNFNNIYKALYKKYIKNCVYSEKKSQNCFWNSQYIFFLELFFRIARDNNAFKYSIFFTYSYYTRRKKRYSDSNNNSFAGIFMNKDVMPLWRSLAVEHWLIILSTLFSETTK
jgi:hypothetical protein